mgnify:CR=1 FL=1|tara:strand:+ start:423 stop:806 length:384 start_codon:yes stop_codon:yes gene_type:complete
MIVETNISFVEQIDYGIIKVVTKKNITPDKKDLEENLRVYREKFGVTKGLFLVVFEEGGILKNSTRDAFLSKERAEMKIAEAIVVKSIPHRIESNFVKRILKPQYPFQIFGNEEKALAWLLTFKNPK